MAWANEGSADSSAVNSRVVKRFDFDERRLGNYDPMPMGWRPIVDTGYPRFLDATFDELVGHDAPPSFHLPLRSGNLGASHSIREIEVDPRSAYRVVGWIRPKHLKRAGAFITACYLGQNMKPMPGTEHRSEKVRGYGEREEWVCVSIDLPSGVKHAKWIALSCRVEQEKPEAGGDQSYSSIDYHDATGEAWFDDIAVIRMPKTQFSLSDSQGIFEDGRQPVIHVKLEDSNSDGLVIEMELSDAAGRSIEKQSIDASAAVEKEFQYAPSSLDPGAYSATLRVRSGDHVLCELERRFVCFGKETRKRAAGSSGIGIILDGGAMLEPKATRRFVQMLRPDLVKVPVWRSDMNDETVLHGAAAFERMVKSLHDDGVGLVGSLESLPRSLADQYPRGRRGLFDVLASEPSMWRPYLALVLTRYGSWMTYWQLGPDEANSTIDREVLASAVRNTADEMRPLIGKSRIVVPQSCDWAIDREVTDGEVVALVQPANRPASQFSMQLNKAEVLSGAGAWATIQPLDAVRYSRLERLADFARGLVLARCHGVGFVFTQMPWCVRAEAGQSIVEPTEELILLSTLGAQLAGLKPVQRVRIGGGTEAWLFANDSRSRGAMVAWADGEAERPTEVSFDFGRDVEIVNVWGVQSTIAHSMDGNLLRLGTMPVIFRDIDPRRVQIAAGFEVDRPTLPPTIEDHERVLKLVNSSASRLRGAMRITVPRGWHISPNRAMIDLESGATASIPVRIRLPGNQAVGEFELVGRLKPGARDGDDWVLRAPVMVESPGLDVDVAAFRDGDRVRVIQRVTNRTSGELDLRASMISPDRPREWRTISRLGAGDSAIRKYEILGGAEMKGKSVRLSVEQVGGGVRHNSLVVLE